MNDIRAAQHDKQQGDSRQAGQLVGRGSEMDSIGAFLATV
jgi:hypothetical protein